MSAALLALALQATAPTWERAGKMSDSTAYFDPASVVIIDSNRRRVRLRSVFDRVSENGGASGTALVELDCVNRSSTLIEMQLLDANGNVLGTRVIPPAERRAQRNPADGPDGVVHARVCGRPAR